MAGGTQFALRRTQEVHGHSLLVTASHLIFLLLHPSQALMTTKKLAFVECETVMNYIPFSLLCRLCSSTKTKSGGAVSLELGSRTPMPSLATEFAYSSYQRRRPYWEARRRSFAGSRSRVVVAAKIGSPYRHSWLVIVKRRIWLLRVSFLEALYVF